MQRAARMGRCHWAWEQPPDLSLSFLKLEGTRSCPLGSRLPRKGWCGGNPVSAQPPSGETLAVHLKVPPPLARGKTLAPPDLGFQPSPGTASTPRQHPSKSRGGMVPVWVWLKKKKKGFHVGSTRGTVNREPGSIAAAWGSSSPLGRQPL